VDFYEIILDILTRYGANKLYTKDLIYVYTQESEFNRKDFEIDYHNFVTNLEVSDQADFDTLLLESIVLLAIKNKQSICLTDDTITIPGFTINIRRKG